MASSLNVAVIGASNKPHRYSNKALNLLLSKGHNVYPVHRRLKAIDDIPVFADILDISDDIHTVTLYVSSDISSRIANHILAKHPQRIIFNPGAENPELEQRAQAKGIQTLNACTLVLLRTSQF